jgi:hypothetical protein
MQSGTLAPARTPSPTTSFGPSAATTPVAAVRIRLFLDDPSFLTQRPRLRAGELANLDGLHDALIACTAIALAGAVATAWLLIPLSRPRKPKRLRKRSEALRS